MTEAHDDALAAAAASAARLGFAIAAFDRDIARLREITPKCWCGWAVGHHGKHLRTAAPAELK